MPRKLWVLLRAPSAGMLTKLSRDYEDVGMKVDKKRRVFIDLFAVNKVFPGIYPGRRTSRGSIYDSEGKKIGSYESYQRSRTIIFNIDELFPDSSFRLWNSGTITGYSGNRTDHLTKWLNEDDGTKKDTILDVGDDDWDFDL